MCRFQIITTFMDYIFFDHQIKNICTSEIYTSAHLFFHLHIYFIILNNLLQRILLADGDVTSQLIHTNMALPTI